MSTYCKSCQIETETGEDFCEECVKRLASNVWVEDEKEKTFEYYLDEDDNYIPVDEYYDRSLEYENED